MINGKFVLERTEGPLKRTGFVLGKFGTKRSKTQELPQIINEQI